MSCNADAVKKTALVTGAGRRRLGNLIARRLAQHGYQVVIHYHQSAGDAEATVVQVEAAGGTASAYQADISDEQRVKAMFHWIQDTYKRIDVLVNTAAIWSPQPLEQVSAEELLKNFHVNTLGTFLCCQQAGLMMVGQSDGGAIINFGDAAIDQPRRDYAAYLVSKGSIPTLTRSLAVEFAARNPRVRVNCIQPGSIMAPPDATAEDRRRRREATLVNDSDQPEMAFHAVRFLIENAFITGACVPLDGGRSLRCLPSLLTEHSSDH